MNHRLGPSVLILFALSGCAKPMYVLDLNRGLVRWSVSHPPPATAKSDRTFEAQFVGSDSLGVLYTPFPVLVPVRGKDELRERLDSEPTAQEATLFTGFGAATQRMLERHLQAYFAHVTVSLSGDKRSVGASVTPTAVVVIPGFFTRTATVEMLVAPRGGDPFRLAQTPARANAAAHLAWAIPAVIGTFPVGTPWIRMAFAGIYKGMEKDKVLEAIDLATAEIAARIAHDQGIAR